MKVYKNAIIATGIITLETSVLLLTFEGKIGVIYTNRFIRQYFE